MREKGLFLKSHSILKVCLLRFVPRRKGSEENAILRRHSHLGEGPPRMPVPLDPQESMFLAPGLSKAGFSMPLSASHRNILGFYFFIFGATEIQDSLVFVVVVVVLCCFVFQFWYLEGRKIIAVEPP